MTPGNLQDLEKQIDDLFNDLKRQVANIQQPRSGWWPKLRNWIYKQTMESIKLEQYRAYNSLFNQLQTALNEDSQDIYAVYDVIDEFKNKFKNIVKTYVSQAVPPAPVNKPIEIPPEASRMPPKSSESPKVTSAPPEAPKAAETKPEAIPDPLPPEVSEPESAKTPPEPPVEEPKVVEPATEIPPEPEVTQKKTKKRKLKAELSEDELIKLGLALRMAQKHSEEDIQDIEKLDQYLKTVSLLDLSQESPEEKEEAIKLAKEHLQKKANKVGGESTGTAPMDMPEASHEELMKMNPKKFENYMTSHDPELVDSYSGGPWSSKGMRQEVVTSHILERNRKQNLKKESLQDIVNKYRNLLREKPSILKENDRLKKITLKYLKV